MTIKFDLGHLSNSTAEAYNVSVPFYFPPYITFESVSSCSNTSVVTTMMVDSAVYFNVSVSSIWSNKSRESWNLMRSLSGYPLIRCRDFILEKS